MLPARRSGRGRRQLPRRRPTRPSVSFCTTRVSSPSVAALLSSSSKILNVTLKHKYNRDTKKCPYCFPFPVNIFYFRMEAPLPHSYYVFSTLKRGIDTYLISTKIVRWCKSTSSGSPPILARPSLSFLGCSLDNTILHRRTILVGK